MTTAQPDELPINHEEAKSLAYLKRQESNLARCYLAVTAEQAVLVTRWKANEDVQEVIIKRLTAERAAYKLDAKRYRWWLRAVTKNQIDKVEAAFKPIARQLTTITAEQFSSCIDTAIAKEAK